jgi:ABC-type enterochelin transport system ATPase subunit
VTLPYFSRHYAFSTMKGLSLNASPRNMSLLLSILDVLYAKQKEKVLMRNVQVVTINTGVLCEQKLTKLHAENSLKCKREIKLLKSFYRSGLPL